MTSYDWTAAVDRALQPLRSLTDTDAAAQLGVSEPTVRRWRAMRRAGEQVPEPRGAPRTALVRALEGGDEQEEAREWADDMLNVVRYVRGEQPMDDAERRRVQLDLLEGMIRLGKDEGREVGKLVALRDQLRAGDEPAAPPPPVQQVEEVETETEREFWRRVDAMEADASLSPVVKAVRFEGLLAARRIGIHERETRIAEMRVRTLEKETDQGDARTRAIDEEVRNSTVRTLALRGEEAAEGSEGPAAPRTPLIPRPKDGNGEEGRKAG